jgi:hypothetical protein
MRVAANLLTEGLQQPASAHRCWTRVIPEMDKRHESGGELHLPVSSKSGHLHQSYGPGIRHIAYPWSNERHNPRTLTSYSSAMPQLPGGAARLAVSIETAAAVKALVEDAGPRPGQAPDLWLQRAALSAGGYRRVRT